MISSSSTEFTAKDGRKFAFPVGTANLDRKSTRRALVRLGAIVPGKLGPIYRGWMSMALAISKVTTPIFMGIVYFLVLTPTGLVMKLLGRRPMRHALDGGGFWKTTRGREPSDLRRQFCLRRRGRRSRAERTRLIRWKLSR